MTLEEVKHVLKIERLKEQFVGLESDQVKIRLCLYILELLGEEADEAVFGNVATCTE